MKRVWIVGLTCSVLIATGLGICHYTGIELDRRLPILLQRIETKSGLKVHVEQEERGLFHRQRKFALTLTPKQRLQLSPLFAEKLPDTLYFQSNSAILPLYINSKLALANDGQQAQTLKAIGLGNWQPTLTSSTNLLLKKNHSQLLLPKLQAKGEEGELAVAPLQLDYNGSLDKEGRLALAWGGMTLKSELDGEPVQLAIGQMSSSAHLRNLEQGFIPDQFQTAISQLSLSKGKTLRLEFKGVESQSQLEAAESDRINSHYQAKIEQLLYTTLEEDLLFEKMNTDILLKGVSRSHYRAFKRASTDNDLELEQATLLLRALFEQGATLELKALNFNLNQQPLHLQGIFTLAPATATDRDQAPLARLEAQLELLLGSRFGEALPPLQPLLETLQDEGYLVVSPKGLSASIKRSADGSLTINEQPF